MIQCGFLATLAGICRLGAAAPIIVRIRLNGVEKIIRIPRGSTVIAAVKQAFSYRRRGDGTTIINGTAGHWRYTVNNIEPRIYAGDYRLTSNCRLDLRRFSS